MTEPDEGLGGGGIGGTLGKLFGQGSIGEQLFVWGLLSSVVQALTGPGVNELSYLVNSAITNVPLDPTVGASVVARALTTGDDAKSDAAKAGISDQTFATLVQLAGSAPDLGSVVTAYQRQLIGVGKAQGDDVSLYGALTDSGIRSAWLPIIKDLAVQIPSVAEVMNAWLEGQITEDEARTRYLAAGGDPTWFQASYNANGEAPTPTQALDLLNRGIIPEDGTGPDATSYEQAFLEGPWRNKWLPSFVALRWYYPPPRTVTAMYHGGQLSHDEAASYLAKQGLQPDLITAYLSPTKAASVSAEKVLAKGDILSLYSDKLITRAKALAGLEALKYSAADADELLTLQDFKATKSALTAGVNRVKAQYFAGKLTKADAVKVLESLEVPSASASDIVDDWDLTQSNTVKVLSQTEIVDAWYYSLVDVDEAIAALVQIGYTENDAWIVLSVKNKGALKGAPKLTLGG